MGDINQCDKCEMRKICKKDNFPDDSEEKIPPCYEATKTIQDKARRDLADEVIRWIKYDIADSLSNRTIKIITLINVAVMTFEIIKWIIHFAK